MVIAPESRCAPYDADDYRYPLSVEAQIVAALGGRLDAEVGYGLPVGTRLIGTPRVGVGTSEWGREYRLGYRLGGLGGEGLDLELGVEAQRRESPVRPGPDQGARAQATVRW